MDEEESIPTSPDDKKNLRIADFLDLYTRPRLFFSGRLNLTDGRYLWFVIWSLGITSQFDSIDQTILRAEMGVPGRAWRLVEPVITSGWGAFWLWSLGFGIVTAAITYLIGGWWYRMRLRFSGAVDPDPVRARLIYCYSGFVLSLPHVVLNAGLTMAYPSYYAAYHSGEMFSAWMPFFIFWAVAVSYSGATSAFSLTPWKARIWFLVIPAAFYIVVMGGVAWLMTLFQ